ncbi:MAG: hypothetical protein JW969_14765 [Spirochaetales bacterium]|nr:hypothetical protein [Spirochaetales bacterium]
MKRIQLGFLFLFMVFLSIPCFCDDFDPILTEYFDANYSSNIIDLNTLTALFETSVQKKRTIFELLNSIIMFAQKTSRNIIIPGNSIREMDKIYQLGGATVSALLPTHIIDNIYINSDEDRPKLELVLTTEYHTSISFGDINLSKRFGFKDAVRGKFMQSFGISAGISIFRFGIDTIDLFPGLEMGAQIFWFYVRMPVKEILRD